MADPKESLNMGSSRTANTISDLDRGIGNISQKSLGLKQIWSDINSVMGSVSSRMRGLFGGDEDGGRAASSSQVAPSPRFNAPEIRTVGYGDQDNSVAPGPGRPNVTGGGFAASQAGPADLSTFVGQNPQAGISYRPEVVSSSNAAPVPQTQTGTGGGGTFIDPDNPPASGAESGGGSLGNYVSRTLKPPGMSNFGALMFNFGLLTNMLPGTNDIVQSNLLIQRAAYFAGAGRTGYGTAASLQEQLAKAGTVSGENPQLDAMNAMVAAQSYGLGGTRGADLLQGVARTSNLVPGMGLEGTMRATAFMQQARNVNMLRGIGIQLRDPDTGRLAPPDEVIDKIWQKICRDYAQAYGTGKKPTLDEVQIALQPGNSLDSMLNMYFGNDPMLKTMVMNGLLFKAQGGGAVTKAAVQELGGTTEAVLSLSERQAATAGLLGQLPTGTVSGVGGFIAANKLITALTGSIGEFFANVLAPLKTFTETILSSGGGFGYNLVGNLAALAPRAEGGPVTNNKTYLVGEKGPEIFVPSTSGYIIPNDELKNVSGSSSENNYNNTYNFTVNVANGNGPEVISAIKSLISEMETNKRVSES